MGDPFGPPRDIPAIWSKCGIEQDVEGGLALLCRQSDFKDGHRLREPFKAHNALGLESDEFPCTEIAHGTRNCNGTCGSNPTQPC